MSKVYPLMDNQAHAVDPQRTVWLSASAGTGKTQVLSARVLRLLLQDGVEPEQLLCLTFTKAGAAEMATRVNEVLAGWVRKHGLPGSLYVDRDSIYRCEGEAGIGDQLAGKAPQTQFGRAMEQLRDHGRVSSRHAPAIPPEGQVIANTASRARNCASRARSFV